MKTILHVLTGLFCLSFFTGCQTTSVTGDHEVKTGVAYQLAELQARYASGDLDGDMAYTSGVGYDSENAASVVKMALSDKIYGTKAYRNQIHITKWELLETNLRRVSAHWTTGKSRMRVSTMKEGDFIVHYNFRVSLSKTAAEPPTWADELYTSEQIIHSLSGFEVTSVRKVSDGASQAGGLASL